MTSEPFEEGRQYQSGASTSTRPWTSTSRRSLLIERKSSRRGVPSKRCLSIQMWDGASKTERRPRRPGPSSASRSPKTKPSTSWHNLTPASRDQGANSKNGKPHNVTATVGYIADFVQKQSDARLTEALVLRFHRMLTYSVPYRHNISGRYRPRRRRRLLPAPARRRPSAAPDDRVRALVLRGAARPLRPPSSRPSSPTVASATVFWGSTPAPWTSSGSHPAVENVEIGPPRIRRPRADILP